MEKRKVLYLDHTQLFKILVIKAGGRENKENIMFYDCEFCFVETAKGWEEQAERVRKRELEYDVVILHYSFAGQEGHKLAKEIRGLLPHARIGVRTGIWAHSFNSDRDLRTILLEAEPDFCFGTGEEEIPFMFLQINKGRTGREEEQVRGWMMTTPGGYIVKELEIDKERE